MTPSQLPDDRNTIERLLHGFSSRVPYREPIGLEPLQRGQRDQGLVHEPLLRPAQERPRDPDLPGGDHSWSPPEASDYAPLERLKASLIQAKPA
jgi:hypothetical protein